MPAYQWDRQAIGQRAITQPWSQEWISAVNSTPIETIFKNLKGYRDEATEKQRFDEWKTKHPDDKTSWEQWVRAMAKGYYPGRLTQNVSVPEFTGPVYGTGQTRTPYDYFVNGQGGYGTPPLGSTPARQTYSGATQYGASSASKEATPESEALYATFKEGVQHPWNQISEMLNDPFWQNRWGVKTLDEWKKIYGGSEIRPPSNESTVNVPEGQVLPNAASPPGNNITSGAVNPTTALSGNNLATTATAPAAGTSTFGTDTSLFNPASGTLGAKRKTGANKYFNQQWFGGKQIA